MLHSRNGNFYENKWFDNTRVGYAMITDYTCWSHFYTFKNSIARYANNISMFVCFNTLRPRQIAAIFWCTSLNQNILISLDSSFYFA